MNVQTAEIKRIAHEVVGANASTILMNRIANMVDQAGDARTAATKVEKLVALFLGAEQAKALQRQFATVLES